MRIKWLTALTALIALVGAGVLGSVGTAQADSNGFVEVEVCAEGNYTAFAKWDGGGFDGDLTHVPAGQCHTDGLFASPNAVSDLFPFGLYNISHHAFPVAGQDATGANGFAVSAAWDKILIRARGTTTDPHWTLDLWGADGQHVSTAG